MEKENKKSIKNIEIIKATGKDWHISTKQAVAICSFIRGKSPQKSIELLEKVMKKKTAVPMKKGAHKPDMPKGKPSGKYPVKAAKLFASLIKDLIANAAVKGIDTEMLIISKAMANQASRPIRGARIAFGRRRFKRSHVFLETNVKEKIKGKNKK